MPQPDPAPPTAAPPSFAAIREREFPLLGDACYLNTAAVGPLPERARRAAEEYGQRRARVHELRDEDFEPVLARCRRAAAGLVGACAEEIALLPNTSVGINVAALGLPIERGQCIVASDREFPANVYPWMRAREGVRLDLVPTDTRGNPDEARLFERLDRGDVAVFALSAVQFATGFRADLKRFGRFCRERGIFFVVDAIQAVGQIPLDVREMEIDVLATGGHKWLCGPFGAGFTYVRREMLPVLEPRVVGWTAMRASDDYSSLLDYRWEFRDDARRYEVATQPIHDYAALARSIELLREMGVERIEQHVRELLDPLIERLREDAETEIVSDLAPERSSGILAFRPSEPERVFRVMRDAGIVCVLREGAIRISPHLYSTREDVGRVIRVLGEARG